MSRPTRAGWAVAAIALLLLAACTSNAAKTGDSSSSGAAPTLSEPDTNKDGKVIIGVLSPGALDDHGYYESFVDAADAFAKTNGWTVIKRGNVPDSQALAAARALCAQHVDMVALGAAELSDAIPASTEPVCAHTAWYVPSSQNIKQTPRIVISADDPNQDLLAAGYAAGLLMQPKGDTKAGYVTGTKADYSVLAGKAFLAGIRLVIPKATLLTAFTGNFDDSGLAVEATQAQLNQGAKAIYPYLGGATDAATKVANTAGALTLTPGTDRCGETAPKFDISVIFSPGDYFLAALEQFKADKLIMGTTKVWKMGVDPYPTVKLCDGTAGENAKLATFIKNIGAGTINPEAEVKKLGG